jgi:hypothetical protein
MIMKRVKTMIVLLMCVVVGYGCMEIEEELTIAKDGSGTLKTRTVLSADLAKMLEGADNSKSNITLTKKELEEEMKKEGVEIKEFKREEKEGKVYISYTVAFKDINLIRDSKQLDDIEFSKDDSGNIVFTRSSGEEDPLEPFKPIDKDLPAEEKAEAEMGKQMMTAMMQGAKYKCTVTFPNDISKTNADKKDGKTVTWEYDLEKLKKLAKTDDTLTMKAVFSAKGVTFKLEKPEEKDEDDGDDEEDEDEDEDEDDS